MQSTKRLDEHEGLGQLPTSWPAPARPGDPIELVDTPALLLDLDAFERNLDSMQQAADRAKMAIRPHAKAHKTPAIALAQMARGAVGICCQKISESLAFLHAGVTDIHISNEIVGPVKARRLAELARHGRLSVCVDDVSQVRELAAATAAAGSTLRVFIEINIGQNRCGVNAPDDALHLLDAILSCPGLRFAGLQAYQGVLQHVRDVSARRDAVGRSARVTAGFIDAITGRGLRCETITGGGTGSVEFDLAEGIYTELQPGSYVFMDGDYGRNEQAGLRFEHSLFVATRVMSRAQIPHLIVDAGLKSLAVDSGLPLVWGDGSFDYIAANDEHGAVVSRDTGTLLPALGSMLRLVPGHCDPTLNLYDHLVAFRANRVEEIWDVAARGQSR